MIHTVASKLNMFGNMTLFRIRVGKEQLVDIGVFYWCPFIVRTRLGSLTVGNSA